MEWQRWKDNDRPGSGDDGYWTSDQQQTRHKTNQLEEMFKEVIKLGLSSCNIGSKNVHLHNNSSSDITILINK